MKTSFVYFFIFFFGELDMLDLLLPANCNIVSVQLVIVCLSIGLFFA